MNIHKLKMFADQAFLSEEASNAQSMYVELKKYFLPNSPTIIDISGNRSSAGLKTTDGVFTSEGAIANRDLASILFTTMCPPTRQWTKLRHRNTEMNNNGEVAEWIDEVNNRVHKELIDSSFYAVLGSAFQSLTALGSMVILHEEKSKKRDGSYNGVRFTELDPVSVAWAEGEDGEVNKLYRKVLLTPTQIIEKFPEGNIPEYILTAAEEKPDEAILIYHCVYPRPKNEIKYSSTGVVPGKNRAFGSYYFDASTCTLIEEDGYFEFPAYVVRYSKAAGEVRGRGPGHIALSEVKVLSSTVEDTEIMNKLAIRPPILAQQRNVIGNLDLRPGGTTYVAKIDAIREWKTGSRLDFAQVQKENLQAAINRIFMLDKLLLPPRQETGEMSAFEVARRTEEAQRVLGPVPSRIEGELLKPLIVRQIQVMLRAGALPALPEVLNGPELDLDISVVSQLARAQSTEQVQAIQQSAQLVAMLAQLNPAAVDLIQVDNAGRDGMRVLGAPESIITSDEELKQVRDQRAQTQAQQMEAELALKQADAASKLGVGGGM